MIKCPIALRRRLFQFPALRGLLRQNTSYSLQETLEVTLDSRLCSRVKSSFFCECINFKALILKCVHTTRLVLALKIHASNASRTCRRLSGHFSIRNNQIF